MTAAVPALRDLLLNAHRRALHLETRDTYPATDRYIAWLEGREFDRGEFESDWAGCLAPLVSRGGDIRRARIVSEPLSSHTRYEYEVTERSNLAAGEQIRWLPRRHALDLVVPANDYWLIDDDVFFNFFDGNGEFVDVEVVRRGGNPHLIEMCETAFERVWEHGIDHLSYQPK